MKTMATERIMFPLDETAQCCSLDPQILRNHVKDGFINPAIRGGPGRRNGHRFTFQQVVGITVACWMWESPRGCKMDAFAETVATYEKQSIAALEHQLGLRNDYWSEEEFTKATGRSINDESPELVIGTPQFDDCVDLYNRLCRVRDLVIGRSFDRNMASR